MSKSNASYLAVIHRNLPRLLALYNIDHTHPLCGCGDRRYWAWKLTDFPNGTFQGAAFGLSTLLVSGLLPKGFSEMAIQRRVEQIIDAVPRLADKNGSLAEALPNEGSFCVTSLVLADCLGAIEVLNERLCPEKKYTLIVALKPLADFLMRQDEKHAIISNHLATAALAMVRWSQATDSPKAFERARLWINRIYEHACDEGWMMEYGGADPGYQSWCSSSLAQIAELTDDINVQPLLDRSFEFMEAFAMPDGSFSNGCGSRLTRFFMPGGAELQKTRSKAAARLCLFARENISKNSFVSLDAIDEPNLIPIFNDLVIAAANARKKPEIEKCTIKERSFKDAGLIQKSTIKGKMVINTRRGGWFCMVDSDGNNRVFEEPVARDCRGHILRPVRGILKSQSQDQIKIESELEISERMLPTAFKFIILRALSLTLFRSVVLGNFVKYVLVSLLISDGKAVKGRVSRTINITNGTFHDVLLSGKVELVENSRFFSPMHMASQGYWQVSDDT